MLSVGLEIGTEVKIRIVEIHKDIVAAEVIYVDEFWSTIPNPFILNEKLIFKNIGARFDCNKKSFVQYNIDDNKKPWFTLCIYDSGNHIFEHYR